VLRPKGKILADIDSLHDALNLVQTIKHQFLDMDRYPEIKDATERALATLKTIRELYISDIRKNTETSPSLSQSNDISAPYILLCNYADATPKLVSSSFDIAVPPIIIIGHLL
jgi:hypothetical protein